MAYEKLYNEIYAMVALKYLWRGYKAGYEKSESPDWINRADSVGIEVSQALLAYDGQGASFLSKWLGKLREEIPDEDKARYGERLYFYNDRLWALLPDPRDGRGYEEKSLYRFKRKLEKLNKHFTPCSRNALYLYAHAEPDSPGELRALMGDMSAAQQRRERQFSLVFLDCRSSIHVFDLAAGTMDTMPVGRAARGFLEQETERIRKAPDPEKEFDF